VLDSALNPGVGPAICAVRDGLLAEHLDSTPEEVARRIEAEGSMIAAIESLRRPGRTLQPYETPDLSSVEAWLADNEVLDPEGPAEMFEPLAKRGLFRRLRQRWRLRRPRAG
jgi:hypothetical protein